MSNELKLVLLQEYIVFNFIIKLIIGSQSSLTCGLNTEFIHYNEGNKQKSNLKQALDLLD